MADRAVSWCFYLVRCRDSSLYSGITRNLEERVRKHNAGTGAKYTLARRPVFVVYSEIHDSVSAAMKREREVKRWPRARKERLIGGPAQEGATPGGQEARAMFEELSSRDPAVKYGAARALLANARQDPTALRPYSDYFIQLLESDNSVLKWTAIDVVGCLAATSGTRIEAPLKRLFALVNSGKLITANHAISALAAIAVARPGYRPRITSELLKVEGYVYETEECRNIALGKVILGLGLYCGELRDRKRVVDFVRRQTHNSRSATGKKAIAFLKKDATE
jgi:predicted GIY-YIG superfamily endonuclease